jgi:drug/metabolite transporter (DMT)-like permease
MSATFSGGTAIGIRFSNRELDPMWGASLRFAFASALLLGVMAVMRLALPRGRAMAGALIYGTLHYGVAMALAYYGLVHLHAGQGQTLMSLVPLLVLLLAALQGQERLRIAGMVGALLAVVGVAALSQAAIADGVPVVSFLALVLCGLSLAQASVLVRRFPSVHPVTLNAVGAGVGAAMLLAGSVLIGETNAVPQRTETWIALGYLAMFGSAAAFVLYVFVLNRWPASRAAYSFVISPFVTVALSTQLDDEPLHAGLIAGGILILAGVYIGALREERAPEPVAPDLSAGAAGARAPVRSG